MRTKELLPVLTVLLALTAGCKAHEPESQQAAPTTAASPATAPATTETTTAPPPAATPAPQASTPAPAPAAAASLASQQTNWPGIVAEVTEFRRKGSTLTARVVLRNQAGAEAEADIHYGEVYLMDAAAGKKYEALKDEKGTYIAALRSGYPDRWYQKLAPGATYTIWVKFPAPPPDVKAVTLQLPGMPPFEDLTIQDS
ncbi:MAG: hypothetical protein QOF89_5100 [Acidobacteriota bacterium]|jgi:hypothetical protein|nr:hypothetical protein [Acidobacteriota bacterium]